MSEDPSPSQPSVELPVRDGRDGRRRRDEEDDGDSRKRLMLLIPLVMAAAAIVASQEVSMNRPGPIEKPLGSGTGISRRCTRAGAENVRPPSEDVAAHNSVAFKPRPSIHAATMVCPAIATPAPVRMAFVVSEIESG